jgi:hypothetical protein
MLPINQYDSQNKTTTTLYAAQTNVGFIGPPSHGAPTFVFLFHSYVIPTVLTLRVALHFMQNSIHVPFPS